ncbi:hypothetical protein GGQ87_001116 [Brevundimonas alba]|uniref:Uncharacterized protein n=1 Tax=Brevundimonas alba TaxID=74314 RepID=A0A7X5YJE2_9CAUL|nr:hypothetical protein [Brevundimonas alba]NJC40858.1 hypothetical protein [Brevundimonas alba]
MSAIRPPVPSPLFPTQTPGAPLSPARASRSDFFRAALDGVAAPAEAKAAPVARPAPPADFFRAEDRPQRPGSLLDIRV